MSYSLLLKFYSHFLGEFYQIKKLLLPKESKSRCVSPNPKICILPPPATIAMNTFIGANGIGQLREAVKKKNSGYNEFGTKGGGGGVRPESLF